jgi:hypothetical protein
MGAGQFQRQHDTLPTLRRRDETVKGKLNLMGTKGLVDISIQSAQTVISDGTVIHDVPMKCPGFKPFPSERSDSNLHRN